MRVTRVQDLSCCELSNWVFCTQITASGAHRCVCVQLRVYNLAVASIERCEALAEMEGSGGIGVDPAAGPAFKVLKQLVHNWLTDAMQNGNR